MQTAAFLPTIARPPSIASLVRNRLVISAAVLGVIAAAAAVAAWQWSWLAAIGVAPLLLSVAPCIAMCGLGLCMHRMGGRACASSPASGQAVRETLQTASATEEK
jgi:hypothetical protein